jgi:hypothetical protein
MKRFISTEFFFLLKKASQKGIDVETQVLENGYEEFVISLFSESTTADKVAYHSALAYTRVELANLTEVSKKKYRCFSE